MSKGCCFGCGKEYGFVLAEEGKFAGHLVCTGCLQKEVASLQRRVTKLSKALVKVQDQGCIGCNVIATKALGKIKT